MREKDAAKAEIIRKKEHRVQERAKRNAIREEQKRRGINGSESEDDESSDEDDDDAEVQNSEISDIDPEDFDFNDEKMLRRLGLESLIKTKGVKGKNRDSEDLSCLESENSTSESGSMYSTDSSGDQDREYLGDMFKDVKPTEFMAGDFEQEAHHNSELETKEYCCISIWSSGGRLMRFTRLKDTTISAPPLANDQTFRIAHDAKRLYYLGMHKGKKKLIVVWLQNLSYQILGLVGD